MSNEICRVRRENVVTGGARLRDLLEIFEDAFLAVYHMVPESVSDGALMDSCKAGGRGLGSHMCGGTQ